MNLRGSGKILNAHPSVYTGESLRRLIVTVIAPPMAELSHKT